MFGLCSDRFISLEPLAIPVSVFLSYKPFEEGSMQSATDKHPLAWLMDKVAEVEATISLEASDNNVLSILRSSFEKMPSASETIPREQENNSVGNDKENRQESGAFLMFESQELETPSSLVSPIIPFKSGIRLEDLIEPEVKQFLDADINDLMAQIGNQNDENDSNDNVVSVNPVIKLDGEQNECFPVSEQQTKRVIDDIFTPKTMGKVRTRGGIRENRG